MGDPHHLSTFITVAPDSAATRARVAPERPGTTTVARVHFELPHDRPYRHTQEDVLFLTWARRRGPADAPDAELAAHRAGFLARSQACLWSSPLARAYGRGFHSDAAGRVALHPVDSPEYRQLSTVDGVTVGPARSRRPPRGLRSGSVVGPGWSQVQEVRRAPGYGVLARVVRWAQARADR